MSDPLFWIYADSYRTYNVNISKALGSVNAAIIFSELAQWHKYFTDSGQLVSDPKHGDGWIYYTAEKCEDRTGLSPHEQRNACNLLERTGLIETKNFGLPCKKHFRMNLEGIEEFSKNVSRSQNNANWSLKKRKLYRLPSPALSHPLTTSAYVQPIMSELPPSPTEADKRFSYRSREEFLQIAAFRVSSSCLCSM